MSSYWNRLTRYLQLTWAGNLVRVGKRKICCEPRPRWAPRLNQIVRNSTDNVCFYCRIPLDSTNPQTRMHIDHYYPWSKGGANLPENLVPACALCNVRKKNMSAVRFMLKYQKQVRPFCRHKSTADGKYCSQEPRLKHHIYCYNHRFQINICK